MTNQMHAQNQRAKQPHLPIPLQGMFQPRPFVMQTQKATQGKQPDLKTSLIQAKQYSHHLDRVSKPQVSQPKMETAKPVQLAPKKKKLVTATNQPANSPAVANPTGGLPFSTLKPNNQRPPKPNNLKGKDSQGQPLTAHHKYGLSKLENDVSSASNPSSTASQNISTWADPQKKKPTLTQQDVAWSPHNIMMGPLSNNRLDDPGKMPGEKYPDLDTHFTASGSVTPNSHAALEIVQGGGLANFNHADLVKKLGKLNNPSQPSPYKPSEWKQPTPGKYQQAGRPAGWEKLHIDDRVKYSDQKQTAKLFQQLPFA